MFSKETYIRRRAELKKLVQSGIVLIFGNNESPCNFPNNGYYPFRQDSSFLYYFGVQRDGLVGVIDIDNDTETLIGDDIDIDDIVWYGSVDSVQEMASQVGVTHSAPMKQLKTLCHEAMRQKRKLHFLPPYRHDIKLQLFDLLGIHPNQQKDAASMPGVTEKFVGGQVSGIAHSYGAMVSFPTIFSQHGEIMHGNPSMALLEEGRLALCDAGAETINNYCSDNTRTMPVGGKFTQRQLEIYSIVEACHDHALELSKPGVKYYDVHMGVCRRMTDRLKELGLMRGDTEEALQAGAHAMFLPHGLGHMMGMDVHDMESLDQRYVGYDEEIQPSTQFGTSALRMGRRLEKGFVVTDEPGIYFIPALIDSWKACGHCKDFLNFDLLESYKDFGGIRLEDDILITDDGCRIIGKQVIPYHPKDVEDYMAS